MFILIQVKFKALEKGPLYPCCENTPMLRSLQETKCDLEEISPVVVQAGNSNITVVFFLFRLAFPQGWDLNSISRVTAGGGDGLAGRAEIDITF